MKEFLKSVSSLLYKEFLTEIRSISAAASLLMLIVTLAVLSAFAFKDELSSPEVICGAFWMTVYFVASVGQLRAFAKEIDSGTEYFLRANTSTGVIYAGKLIYNFVLAAVSNLLASILFFGLLFAGSVRFPMSLLGGIIVASLAVSAVMTILSAMVSKAGHRGSLLPVLAFPVLLPVLYTGFDFTLACLQGGEIIENIIFLLMFAGCVISVSSVLCDFILND